MIIVLLGRVDLAAPIRGCKGVVVTELYLGDGDASYNVGVPCADRGGKQTVELFYGCSFVSELPLFRLQTCVRLRSQVPR